MAHDKYHGSVERLPNGGYVSCWVIVTSTDATAIFSHIWPPCQATPQHYTHGAFLGHVVPGSFFIVWGSWWALSLFHSFIRSRMQRRPFRSRAWFALPLGPAWLQQAPLEPALKVLLPSIGALGELWLGHESWRSLYASDGKFFVDNLNDWQHSLMYLCFILSGGVDLLGHYAGLPAAMEHTFLGLAFLGELLLLAFHLKGPAIEVELHLILALQARGGAWGHAACRGCLLLPGLRWRQRRVPALLAGGAHPGPAPLQVGATVLSVLGEALAPSSLVAACMRPYWTIVQGAWWIQVRRVAVAATAVPMPPGQAVHSPPRANLRCCPSGFQTAYAMFVNNPAFDPDYMGGEMMASGARSRRFLPLLFHPEVEVVDSLAPPLPPLGHRSLPSLCCTCSGSHLRCCASCWACAPLPSGCMAPAACPGSCPQAAAVAARHSRSCRPARRRRTRPSGRSRWAASS